MTSEGIINENIIYALRCPFTERTHYIGKSTQGLTRPMQHLTDSHSRKIREWVADLAIIGEKPIITVIDYANEKTINERERFWIAEYLRRGAVLFNEQGVKASNVRIRAEKIQRGERGRPWEQVGNIIRAKRKSVGLTQSQLSQKAGIGLRFIRELEQGVDKDYSFKKVQEILDLFGCTLVVTPINRVNV